MIKVTGFQKTAQLNYLKLSKKLKSRIYQSIEKLYKEI